MRSFIDDDLPYYPKTVNIKYIPGADPEMVFFDSKDKEVKRVEVTEKSQKEINALLEAHNFKKLSERIEKEPQYEEDEGEPEEPEGEEIPFDPEQEMGGEFEAGQEETVSPDEEHEQAPGEERVEPTQASTHKPSDEL